MPCLHQADNFMFRVAPPEHEHPTSIALTQLAVHVAYHLTLETAFLNDAIATYPEDAVQRFLSHSAETGSTCTVDTPSRDKDKDPAEAVRLLLSSLFLENSRIFILCHAGAGFPV